MLNLNAQEAAALSRELEHAGPDLDSVKGKLAALVTPTVPEQIPGQTDIYDHLEDAA